MLLLVEHRAGLLLRLSELLLLHDYHLRTVAARQHWLVIVFIIDLLVALLRRVERVEQRFLRRAVVLVIGKCFTRGAHLVVCASRVNQVLSHIHLTLRVRRMLQLGNYSVDIE